MKTRGQCDGEGGGRDGSTAVTLAAAKRVATSVAHTGRLYSISLKRAEIVCSNPLKIKMTNGRAIHGDVVTLWAETAGDIDPTCSCTCACQGNGRWLAVQRGAVELPLTGR